MCAIVFGTDGWRALINEEFNLGNVKIVSQAIADYIIAHNLEGKGVVVGYDTRKSSLNYAEGVCNVLIGNNILTYLTKRDVPTPVTAFEVYNRNSGGAIMITASHNPPEYNGIKYIPEYAGPATNEITDEITENIKVVKTKRINESTIQDGMQRQLIKMTDPRIPYIEFVERQINLESMKGAKLLIIYDPMYGTGRGYLDKILRDAGCEVSVIHNKVDPNFGGHRPEPIPKFLTELQEELDRTDADLGLATDGDADRLGVLDSDGTYYAANQLLPMLFDHIIKSMKRGGVVRTVATTHMVDRIAEKYGLPHYEVPVGFKYVGKYLREEDIVIGAEESGGFGFANHIPEKDGILTCAKVAEMVANSGITLSQLFYRLQSEYGFYISGRVEETIPASLRATIMEKLSSNIPENLGSVKVKEINRMDGLKLILQDGGWLLIRPSGTEPLLRIYGEASNKERLKEILEEGKGLASKAII
ncbi:MAG: phosphoglucomutase/phosphomannomutase family protein [Candidatus Bathyarchaeota archaeon]|nr:phosphoglucomutase/phosphomannomutase family protein [Candidatus Bathyarchaeota archaeon]